MKPAKNGTLRACGHPAEIAPLILVVLTLAIAALCS